MNVLAQLDEVELANHRASDAIIQHIVEANDDDQLSHHHICFLPFIDEFPSIAGQTVLDIGCGPGLSVSVIEEMIPQCSYTGVDISDISLTIARERFPDKQFILANLYDLPQVFPPHSFRFFLAQGVLCHLSRHRMRDALRAIHAVIEPGGYGMVSMGIGTETEVVTEYQGRQFSHPMHIHHWDERAFRKELVEAGFLIADPVSCYNCNVMTDIVQKPI